jgi:hypothetical protein
VNIRLAPSNVGAFSSTTESLSSGAIGALSLVAHESANELAVASGRTVFGCEMPFDRTRFVSVPNGSRVGFLYRSTR